MKAVEKLKTDVVVVGSGPGGSTVARDLIMKGKKVVQLEWGKNVEPKGTIFSAYGFTNSLIPLGSGILIAPGFLTMVRCITLGGTSMMYLGCAWDPPAEMFKKFGIDLSKEADEVKKELHVDTFPDEYMGAKAKLIMQTARDLGLNWNKIPKFYDMSQGKPTVYDFYYGSKKKGAKWQAREWALDAASKGAKLMTSTFCDEVIVEGKTATGVRATGPGGQEYEISADAVVVSGGGVGSPTLLQRSGLLDAGSDFFFDPFVLTYGYLDRPYEQEIPMVAGVHLEKEGVIITDMTTTYAMHLFYALISGKIHKAPKEGRVISFMSKVRDDMAGHVSMGGGLSGGVTKPLTRDDLHKLNIGRAISTKIIRKLGARDIWYSPNAAAHPGGTCRIGKIVDKNLQTEYKNLYVADGSVIPEPFGLPPVLTIICLAKRLANHLTSKGKA